MPSSVSTSEAPDAAAVHCVIVGFDREKKPAPVLFDYPDIKADPNPRAATNINPYLVDAPNLLVDQRRTPLSPLLDGVSFGNMARDGGNLLIGPEEYAEVMADPTAAKYVRRFVGARELIRGTDRWCLWLVDLDPADLSRSPILRKRLEAVRAFRAESKAASTRAMANTPHLFGQRSQPDVPYLCIPRHVSEDRRYFTAARLPADVIAGDANFKAPDPDGFLFSVISSSMFAAWQKGIGGRIKSDLRFANTLTWNNLPLPEMDREQRGMVIVAGQGVQRARDLRPERSLAQHYHPLAMDPDLLKAHQVLDSAVDRAFGAMRMCSSNLERQSILFERYAELTAGLINGVAKPRKRKGRTASAPLEPHNAPTSN